MDDLFSKTSFRLTQWIVGENLTFNMHHYKLLATMRQPIRSLTHVFNLIPNPAHILATAAILAMDNSQLMRDHHLVASNRHL